MADDQVLDQTKEVTPEVIDEAKQYGWVPREHFRGDPKEWVDAAEYVKRGRNSIPILRKKLNDAETKYRSLSGEVSTLKQDMATVRQVAQAQAEAEWKARFDALKAEKVQAIQDDDAVKIVELDEAIAEHKEKVPEKPKAAAQELPPDQQEWLGQNTWYGPQGDKKLTARANVLAAGYAQEGLRGVALFEAVKADLIEMFPEEMAEHEGHEPPTKVASRNGSTHRAATRTPTRNTQSNERSYENLPPEAKEACDRLVRQKQLTQDEYVKHFKGWK